MGALIIVQIASHRATERLIQTSQALDHARRTREALEKTLITVDDAETGQRGYLLSRQDSYLGSYEAAIKKLPGLLARLEKLTADNSEEHSQLAALNHLIGLKREELAKSIELQKVKGPAAAMTVALAGNGKQAMDAIRNLITKMKGEERNRIVVQDVQWEASARKTSRLMTFGLITIFAAILLVILILNIEASERVRVERALREGEMQFKLLVESVRDYAILMLDPEGRVISWNLGAERIKGYTEQEILGRHFSCFYSLEDVEAGKPAKEIETALALGRVEDEGWRVRKDGSRFWATVLITAVRDEQGNLRGFSKVARDITERKRVDEEIQRLNRDLKLRASDLETSNKELEAFTYSVSHDLRAPLRHIDGFSQMLVEEYGPQLPEGAQGYIARIRGGVRQMGQLVDALLSLARLNRQDMRLQVSDLSSLVDQVMDEVKREVNGRTIDWKIQALPFVECDPALMKQVFVSLLSNAVKYTRPREHAMIEVGTASENGRPVVFVRDNGVGFNMKYADKLFGVFQRLHRAEEFEGNGVGLAIVSRIIHRHGGSVWAESELDKGATFYFKLGTSAN